MSKVLVVQYSRTGTTRKLAEAIVAATGWDLEDIVDTRDRSGILGFLRSGFEAMLGRQTRLRPAQKDPRDYDLVVIGSPVWDKTVSVPVHTYLAEHAQDLRRVAFFVTFGGDGSAPTFDQMARLAGQAPLSRMAVTQAQLQAGEHLGAVALFVDELRVQLATSVFDLPPPPRKLAMLPS